MLEIQRSNNDGNQRWPHSMTTPWKRLLLSWHQVTLKLPWFENGLAPSQPLVTGLPAYDNTTVFVDRADEAYLEKLAEVQNHLCWTNLCFSRTWFVSFWSGAHPECPWHLELGWTGWHFFHQEPGTNQHNRAPINFQRILESWIFFRANVEVVLHSPL